MGLSSRLLRPWAPLLAALCLPASAAERAAAAACGAPSDRSSAKALALVAQGLCFSAASENDEAEWAFLQAVELDPALFAAREGLAEQQRRRGLPRLSVRTLLDGARAAGTREAWRAAAQAALEMASRPPEEAGLDVAITDRESFREAVRGLAACPGEGSAADEALLAAGFLYADNLPEAARRFRAHLRKLPPGAAPAGPQRALYARLMNAIAESASLPFSDKGPLLSSLAEAMLAAAPDWNRPETARLVMRSIRDLDAPGMSGLFDFASEGYRCLDSYRLKTLTQLIALDAGDIPVYLHIPSEKVTLLCPRENWTGGSAENIRKLKEAFGPENVVLRSNG